MPTRLTTTDLRFIRDNPNLSDREIADRLGFSRTWITIIRKKHGIVKHSQMMKPETKQFIITRSDWRLIDLIRATGHHSTTISRFLNK